MTERPTAAIVLAAGLGTRMKSSRPKVLHPIAGRSMIGHVLANLATAGISRVVTVVGPGMEAVAEAVAPVDCVIQHDRLGTGHAALMARDALAAFDGDVLVVFGDSPFIAAGTIGRMIAARQGKSPPAVVVLGMRPEEPGAYGRLVIGADGALEAIVEARDATPEQLDIPLCNSGVMAVDGALLFDLLGRVGNGNAKGEYYLTDIVALARRDGHSCAVVEAPEAELLGVNSRADLARAEAVMQGRLRAAAMDNGATLIDPGSVFFSWDTRLGRDVTVGPHVFFGPGVTVEDDVEIRSCCHFENAVVGQGSIIGPFVRFRMGAEIGANTKIGNFVEVKNSVLEEGVQAGHLAYLGDARIGAGTNIGAGTITCNYDGFAKHLTRIGAGAFIGSNTALVAPVSVGRGAIVGAGSTVTRDVADDALAIARGRQEERAGWAADYRARRTAEGKED
jgi:bifunctional UDP-N-acetylglucosamine pyrophosphorylase/glucosamine-1-phosphate N-acetyltransferase